MALWHLCLDVRVGNGRFILIWKYCIVYPFWASPFPCVWRWLYQLWSRSHLTTLYNYYILVRLVSSCASIFHHSNNIHPINYLAKDNMFVVQKWSCSSCDEKLTSICVWTGILILLVSRSIPKEKGNTGLIALDGQYSQPCLAVPHDRASRWSFHLQIFACHRLWHCLFHHH